MSSLAWPDQFFLLHGEGKERIGLATRVMRARFQCVLGLGKGAWSLL